MSPKHHKHLEALRNKHGPIYALPMAFNDVSIIVSDPAVVAALVPFGSKELPKFAEAYEPFNMMFTHPNAKVSSAWESEWWYVSCPYTCRETRFQFLRKFENF